MTTEDKLADPGPPGSRVQPSKRVLVLIHGGGGGDWHPTMAVAERLYRRGHEVRLLCNADNSAGTAFTGIPSLVVPPEFELGRYWVDWQERVRRVGYENAGDHPILVWSDDCLPDLRSVVAEFNPDVIVSQIFCMDMADRVSQETGIPWALIHSTFYFGRNYSRPIESDYAGPAVELRRHWLPIIERANIALFATDPVFDFAPGELPERSHYVGPIFWETPGEVPEYLEQPGKPWALATLSLQSQEDEDLLALMTMRALSRRPLRVVLTVPDERTRQQLKDAPENIKIEAYVSHSEVLRTSVLFLGHAGHVSVMKALYYGVPMVLVPWGRDQPGVAARAHKMGVAKVVERDELSTDSLESAIDEVLREPRYREQARIAAERLRTQDPVGLACDHIQRLLH